MPENSIPRLPATRSIHWIITVWRAAWEKPLWLLAPFALAAVQIVLLAAAAASAWFITRAEPPGGLTFVFVSTALIPTLFFGMLPLLVAPFSAAACRHFLPVFSGVPLQRRLQNACTLSALLLVLLFIVFLAAQWPWHSLFSSTGILSTRTLLAIYIAGIVCEFHAAACGIWLALVALLAQALLTCGLPLYTSLTRASRAALRPAVLLHAAIFAFFPAAALLLNTLMLKTPSLLLETIFYGIFLYAFLLDALKAPWLIVRDMFLSPPQEKPEENTKNHV